MPLSGRIYVDDRFLGNYAPGQIVVRPGTHKVEVRKDNYVSVDTPRMITVEESQALKFRLKKVNNP